MNTPDTEGVEPSFFRVFAMERLYPLTTDWELFLRLGNPIHHMDCNPIYEKNVLYNII